MSDSWTAERFDAGGWIPPWVRHQHETRYDFAAQFVADRGVVDAACGVGASTARFAERGARWVVGCDRTISLAPWRRIENETHTLLCLGADVTRLPLDDHCCDVVVSLETVEHIPDDRAWLHEVRRILHPAGVLIASTPNRDVTNPGTTIDATPYNPHHVREYTRREFDALLALGFSERRWFGQSFYGPGYQRTLAWLGSRLPRWAVRLHQLRKLSTALLDRPARHAPRPWDDRRAPEILVVVARGEAPAESSPD